MKTKWNGTISRLTVVSLLSALLSPLSAWVGPTPSVEAAPLTDVEIVEGEGDGYVYVASLKSDGSVWVWGNQRSVTMGDYERADATKVPGLSDVVDIAGGSEHILALEADGDLFAWGENYNGQLGTGDSDARYQPTLVMTDVKQIAAGYGHTVALKSDNTVYAWGLGGAGQLGDGLETSQESPVQVKTDETTPLVDVAQVAAGYDFSFAVTVTGAVYAWGQNDIGELGLGESGGQYAYATPIPGLELDTSESSSDRIYAHWSAEYAMATVGGDVYGWGDASIGDNGFGLNAQGTESCAVYSDYYGWYFYYDCVTSPTPIPNLPPVESVALGATHTLFHAKSGELYGVGDNYDYQLTGNVNSTNEPVLLSIEANPELTGIASVFAGAYSSFAVKDLGAGTLGWGYTAIPPNPDLEDHTTPVEVSIAANPLEPEAELTVQAIDAVTGEAISGSDAGVWLSRDYGTAYPFWDETTQRFVFYNLRPDAEGSYHDLEVTYGSEYHSVEQTIVLEEGVTEHVVHLTPKWVPSSFSFRDEDPSANYIEGYAYIDVSYYETDVEYRLYFADDAGERVGAVIGVNSYYWIDIPKTEVPTEAVGLRLEVYNESEELSVDVPLTLLLVDEPVNVPELYFQDTNEASGIISPQLTWSDPAQFARYDGYELFYKNSNSESEADEQFIKSYPIGQGSYTYDGDADDDGEPDREFYEGDKFVVRFYDDQGNYSESFSVTIHDNIRGDSFTPSIHPELSPPTDALLTDLDADPNEIGGRLSWRPDNYAEGHIVYFVDESGTRIEPFLSINDGYTFLVDIPMDTELPPGATSVAVFSTSDYIYESSEGAIATVPGKPEGLEFMDWDGVDHAIGGTFSFDGLTAYVGIDRHEVFFADGAGNPIGERVAVVTPRNHWDYHTQYEVEIAGSIPSGATHIGVRTVAGGEAGPLEIIKLWDDRMFPKHFRLYDTDPDPDEISPVFEWEAPNDESGLASYYIRSYMGTVATVAAGTANEEGKYILPLTYAELGEATYFYMTLRDQASQYTDLYLDLPNVTDLATSATEMPTAATQAGLGNIEYADFENTAADEQSIAGDIRWYDTDYSNVTGHRLYVLNDSLEKLLWLGTSTYSYYPVTFSLHEEVSLPEGSMYLAIYPIDDEGRESDEPALIELGEPSETPGHITDFAFVDTDLGTGEIRGVISWKPPVDEAGFGIAEYEVGFANEYGAAVGDLLGEVAAGSTTYALPVPANTAIPSGSGYILIVGKTAGGSIVNRFWHVIDDSTATGEGSESYKEELREKLAELSNDPEDPISVGQILKFLRTAEEDITGDGEFDHEDVKFVLDLIEPMLVTPSVPH